MPILQDLGWAAIFVVFGCLLGFFLVLLASMLLPRILNRLTPNLDEEKEIARGNIAVGQYFGRVVAAGIIGMSIIVAAAILGGIIAGLHG